MCSSIQSFIKYLSGPYVSTVVPGAGSTWMKSFLSKGKYRPTKEQSPGQVRSTSTCEKTVPEPREHQNMALKPVGATVVSRNASRMRHKTSLRETGEHPDRGLWEERENVAWPSCCWGWELGKCSERGRQTLESGSWQWAGSLVLV